MASLRAAVWTHFSKDRGGDIATCNLCSATISCKTGTTTNMKAHLKRKHGIDACAARDSPNGPRPKSSKIDTSRGASGSGVAGQLRLGELSKLSATSKRSQSITSAIGYYLAKDLRPFSTVENQGFVNLLKVTEPRYVIPCRKHFSNKVIPDLVKCTEETLRKDMLSADFFALTSDGWTSRATESYETITVHYIDDNWTMKNHVLQTKCVNDHSSAFLSEMIKSAIQSWNLHKIQSLPVMITTDNASNIVKAVRLAETLN